MPWSALEAVIDRHYPKMGPQGGRRAFPLFVMLRIYCLQQWYQLSDPGAEEALYDIQSMRTFAGLELGRDAIPDETTILNFRHLLERHDLTKAIFAAVAEPLEEARCEEQALRQGTRESRARVPRSEVPVWIPKAALPGDQKEWRTGLLASRSRQHLPRTADADRGVTASWLP